MELPRNKIKHEKGDSDGKHEYSPVVPEFCSLVHGLAVLGVVVLAGCAPRGKMQHALPACWLLFSQFVPEMTEPPFREHSALVVHVPSFAWQLSRLELKDFALPVKMPASTMRTTKPSTAAIRMGMAISAFFRENMEKKQESSYIKLWLRAGAAADAGVLCSDIAE